MAMKLAFEQLYDKTNYNEVIQLATRIFEDAMAIYENYGKKSETKIEDSTENDDLPFQLHSTDSMRDSSDEL